MSKTPTWIRPTRQLFLSPVIRWIEMANPVYDHQHSTFHMCDMTSMTCMFAWHCVTQRKACSEWKLNQESVSRRSLNVVLYRNRITRQGLLWLHTSYQFTSSKLFFFFTWPFIIQCYHLVCVSLTMIVYMMSFTQVLYFFKSENAYRSVKNIVWLCPCWKLHDLIVKDIPLPFSWLTHLRQKGRKEGKEQRTSLSHSICANFHV